MPVALHRRSALAARLVPALCLASFFAAPAAAQLIGMKLPDALEKKHEKLMIARGSQKYLICEPVSGFTVDVNGGPMTSKGPVFVVCVPDFNKPDAPLYDGVDKEGNKKPAEGRRLAFTSKELPKLDVVIWDKVQTLSGLRDEFVRKREEIEGKRKQLGALKVGTPEWFNLHRTLLIDVDALVGWLRSTLYAPAAESWEKQYAGELKKAGVSASKSRLETAKRVVKADVPENLAPSTKEAGKGDLKWHAKSSQHIRIIAHGGIESGRLDAALTIGERIIEQVRTDFIDPYLQPDDQDPVKDEIFIEFMFCPDDNALCTHLWEKFYGMSIGQPRAETEKMNHRGSGGPGFLSLCKQDGGGDLEGWVAHNLGHFIGDVAFNGYAPMPAWCGEGFAYWVSFEHLSRNSVTCFAWSVPTYARAADKVGEKRVEEGMRAAFNQIALTQGPSMSDLFQTPLATMTGAHLAKAWSVIDWMVSAEPKRLREFMRGAGRHVDNGRTQIEKFRPLASEIFEVKTGDVYQAMDEVWRKYATVTGGEARPKKKM